MGVRAVSLGDGKVHFFCRKKGVLASDHGMYRYLASLWNLFRGNTDRFRELSCIVYQAVLIDSLRNFISNAALVGQNWILFFHLTWLHAICNYITRHVAETGSKFASSF
jgi:hypothetical protein